MLRATLLLAISLATFSVQAARIDSLIRQHTVFFNAHEEDLFDSIWSNQSEDYFRLMLLSHSDVKIKNLNWQLNRVNEVVEDIASNPKRNAEKNAKHVFDELQNSFLRLYRENAEAYEIFESGTFNCLTATALYAQSLEALGIPYACIEKPSHVYVVANPDDEQIIMETTDPVDGVRVPSSKEKRAYIEELRAQKMIDQSYEGIVGDEVLYDIMHFINNRISLREVLALHYYNLAHYAKEVEDYETAVNQIMKAFLLYPISEDVEGMLYTLWAQQLENLPYEDLRRTTYMGFLLEFNNYSEQNEKIFERNWFELSRVLLENDLDTALYRQHYERLHFIVSDSAYLHTIEGEYHYNLALALFYKQRYTESLPDLIIASTYYPQSSKINIMLVRSILQQVMATPEPSTLIQYMDSLVASYPHLMEMDAGNNAYMFIYLANAMLYFEDDDTTNGDRALKEFERRHTDTSIEVPLDIIASAYGEGWRCAVRRNNLKSAKAYLMKGLEHSPNNPQLNGYMDSHEEYEEQ